ncbi:Hypothetical predicted protein [Paramuricea clavata]|uniref:Uncharacterized protein n=1 Tax=Paramuricea clavata TaxID=317549 RepID=A0A7D9IIQ2_PARCT|nr:Hypothetical predicted protein [Paramuricea clavata]
MSAVLRNSTVSILQHVVCDPTPVNIANVINNAFLASMSDFSPLSPNVRLATDNEPPFTVTEQSVFQKLSLIEYACPVYHDGLPTYLSSDLETIQRRAMRIIYPTESYEDALLLSGLTSLFLRRQQITNKVFLNIMNDDAHHKLHELLPAKNNISLNLRKKTKFINPRVKTNRYRNSFIISNSIKA